MFAIIHLLATFIADLFKPPCRLEVQNLFLRRQLNISLRGAPHRPRLRGSDRALLVWMTWLWPSLLGSCGGIEQGFGPIGAEISRFRIFLGRVLAGRFEH
jgi:hypothetical protein